MEMPAAGLEPARCCQQQILSLPRLPFRHAGVCKMNFLTTQVILTYAFCFCKRFFEKIEKFVAKRGKTLYTDCAGASQTACLADGRPYLRESWGDMDSCLLQKRFGTEVLE